MDVYHITYVTPLYQLLVSLPMDTAKVQHVTKNSSDELLSKFAEVGCEEDEKKRRKKGGNMNSMTVTALQQVQRAALVERRSLLPPKFTRRSVVLRQLRIRNNSSLFGNIRKMSPIPFTFSSDKTCFWSIDDN